MNTEKQKLFLNSNEHYQTKIIIMIPSKIAISYHK